MGFIDEVYEKELKLLREVVEKQKSLIAVLNETISEKNEIIVLLKKEMKLTNKLRDKEKILNEKEKISLLLPSKN